MPGVAAALPLLLLLLQPTPLRPAPGAAAADVKIDEKEGITLAFVFDSTGSMSDELRQVKQAMQEIFDFMRENRANEIADFALVPFNDPGFGPATITTNSEQYRESLDAITVSGGDDCPELAMHGLKLALEKTRPFSYLFVFTDASAKDYSMRSEVEDLIQQKRSKVVFVLTGRCREDDNDPGYQAYKYIADISNGHVFNLLKNEVHQVLEFVKVDTVKKGIIASGDIPVGHKIESVPVDSSVKVLSVTATGERPSIDFTDPSGEHEEGKTTLDLGTVVSKVVVNPVEGTWTVDVGSRAPGHFVVAAESSFDFDYGFAIHPTQDITETSHRPLTGTNNTLLIKITNSTSVSHLSSVVIKDTKNKEFERRNLLRVPGDKDVYVIENMFLPPNTPFLLQVSGVDVKGNTLTRTSDSGVTPQLPSPPVITLAENVTADQGVSFSLKCHVKSLVPFVGSWDKGSLKVQEDKEYLQSSDVPLEIEHPTSTSEGNYTCKAKNSAGSASRHVIIIVKAKPVLSEADEREIASSIGKREELTCTIVEGDPTPVITWYRDGTVLEKDELLTLGGEVFSNGSLILSYIKPENEGTYECEAANSRGKTRISVTVSTLEPPVITLEEEATAVKGEFVSLNCHVKSISPFVASWHKDAVNVQEDREYIESSDVLLEIENPTLSSKGKYTCKATNRAGSVSKDVILNVEAKPILSEPKEHYILSIVGQREELTCTILEGNPTPIITWYRDGELLEKDELLALGGEVISNGSLILSYIKPENEGTYECEATNSRGKTRISVTVATLVPPSFTGDSHIVLEAVLGDAIRLPCVAQGIPKPRVLWERDHSQLTDDLSFGRNPRDDSLIIMSVKYAHNGTYQCIAYNSAGENRKTIDVLVREKPRIMPTNEFEYPDRGEEVTLHCEVQAFPEADIRWFKNGNPVDTETVNFSTNNSTLRFIADVATSGKYECVASNIAGEDRNVVTVSVGVAPFFNESRTEKVITSVGENVSLLCNSGGFPPPTYSWKIHPDDTLWLGESVYTLYNVQPEAEAMYRCEVDNFAGHINKTFHLIVLAPPVINADMPKRQVLQSGGNFELPCYATGKPKPKVRWFKNGKPISSEFFDNSLLNIDNASEDDAGIYTCRAENNEGIDEKEVMIILEVPPTIEHLDFSVVEVNETNSVTLSCPAISGYPPPKVRWLKNGKVVSHSRRKSLKDGGKSLLLKKVSKRDAGIYTCFATNSIAAAKVDLSLVVLEAPHFLKKSTRKDVFEREGSSLELDCSSEGYPEPTVWWLRNDHPMPPTIVRRVEKSSNGQNITVHNTELTDNGVYKCIVQNKGGRIERTFNVEIFGSIINEGIELEGVWGEWSVWSECSSPCGHSEQVRVRSCSGRGAYCYGEADQWRRCHVAECKVDGGWSSWGHWSLCSASCATGKRSRQRLCNNPAPEHSGELCFGSNTQSEACNSKPCPVDGAWTEWTPWRACSGPCPHGTNKRIRKCANPPSAFGGRPCEGNPIEYRPCVQEGCPVAGGWSEWGPWSGCSATCGHSVQARERSCTNPEPAFGGAQCVGEAKETKICEIESCDKIPLTAIIKIEGFLNGHNISDLVANISISDDPLKRSLSGNYPNIFKNKPWFPFLLFIISPVTWATALEKNKAMNGFTLTKGIFKQSTHVQFETGEQMVLTHTSNVVSSLDGILQLDATIQGQVPLFPSRVKVSPYKEYYIQIGPGEIYASSHNTLEDGGYSLGYSWNKNIKYDPALGKQVYLTEVLSVFSITSRKRMHSESSSIDRTEDTDCPIGFTLSHEGYCQDVDECLNRRSHWCHLTQACVNSIGTYSCKCPFGLKSAAKGARCEDVDECTLSPAPCSHGCRNLQGSFKCLCPPGMSLLESNTTCSSILPKRRTPFGDVDEWVDCFPQHTLVDGFCEVKNPCDNGDHICGEDEICLSIHGLYKCLPFPCPEGYQRIENTKNCKMDCSEEAPCDLGAEVSQLFVPIVLSPHSPAEAYNDIIHLPLFIEGHTFRTHISYRIMENEEGKPFRVKIHDGIGILYSMQSLATGKEYRVAVQGTVYDESEDHILHAADFLITIYTPSD